MKNDKTCSCSVGDEIPIPAPPTWWQRKVTAFREYFRGPVGPQGPRGLVGDAHQLEAVVKRVVRYELVGRTVWPSKKELGELVSGIAESWERAGTGTFRVKRTEFTDAPPTEVSETEKALDALAGGLGQYNPVCEEPGYERKTPHHHFHNLGELAGTIDLKSLREERAKTPTVPAFNSPVKMTLPTDSKARKEIPIFRGVLRYFPAALAGVAAVSKRGNDKHNPGEDMHHARGKSADHGDCILRHLMDIQDLVAAGAPASEILHEADQMVWRALAYSQILHEERGGAPLAPGAKVQIDPPLA